MNDKKSSLWPFCQQLNHGRFVDLTRSFKDTLDHKNSSFMQVEEIATYQKDGFSVQRFQFEGRWGTHIDAPSHLIENGRTLEQISLKEMILPLVVIDIHEKIAKNPDYILLVDDVLSWEDQYGPIPMGSFVALRTDWSKLHPDDMVESKLDQQQIPHYPGWGLDALSYLYENCEITASGQETVGPDAGFRLKETNRMCKRYILSKNHYQINLLSNLDQCPPKGAIVFCTFPKPYPASNFPASVFAICPN